MIKPKEAYYKEGNEEEEETRINKKGKKKSNLVREWDPKQKKRGGVGILRDMPSFFTAAVFHWERSALNFLAP